MFNLISLYLVFICYIYLMIKSEFIYILEISYKVSTSMLFNILFVGGL